MGRIQDHLDIPGGGDPDNPARAHQRHPDASVGIDRDTIGEIPLRTGKLPCLRGPGSARRSRGAQPGPVPAPAAERAVGPDLVAPDVALAGAHDQKTASVRAEGKAIGKAHRIGGDRRRPGRVDPDDEAIGSPRN